MYVSWSNEEEFLRAAARNAPWRYRLFRWSIPIEQLDARHPGFDQWLAVKSILEPGDLIWPFEFNRMTMAYRKGYVVIRNQKPIDVIVLIAS
jgi:hypothetical protein